jgi:hypothetical protein
VALSLRRLSRRLPALRRCGAFHEIEHGAKKYRACEFDCRGKHYAMVESRGQVIMIIGWEHGGETG